MMLDEAIENAIGAEDLIFEHEYELAVDAHAELESAEEMRENAELERKIADLV